MNAVLRPSNPGAAAREPSVPPMDSAVSAHLHRRSSRLGVGRGLVATLLLAGSVTTAFGVPPGLIHRWSFNGPAGSAGHGTVFADSISGLPLEVRGLGATLAGTSITLPGTTTSAVAESAISAYLNLPNGVISSKTALTVEIWATPLSARNWASLFEFGRYAGAGDGLGQPGEWTGTALVGTGPTAGSDLLALTLTRDTSLNLQRQVLMIDGGWQSDLQTSLPTVAGEPHHYVVTVTPTPGGSGVAWYRDGVLVAAGNAPFALSAIEDVNVWFGRSQFGLDTGHTAYDEIRLYDRALAPAEIIASRNAGTDSFPGVPVAVADAATLHPQTKVRVAVLANDMGSTAGATVEIVTPPQYGTAVPDAQGRILYSHATGSPGSDAFTYRLVVDAGVSEPATVTLTFATGLRIANPSLNVPSSPPATAYQLVPAFGALGFSAPMCVASPPGDPLRLFVCERAGIIRLVPNVTAPSPSSSVFLDLPAVVAPRGEWVPNHSQFGLVGLVFHPDYAVNRQFFVFYSVSIAGQVYERLSRFTTQQANPAAADPNSELILIQQRDDFGDHLGGDLHFGPDGYLYVSVGDEGGQNDSSQNAQRIDGEFFSALMRIDVDKRPGNPAPNPHVSVPTDAGIARYSVPIDNPFVTDNPTVLFNGTALPAGSIRTEFWAVGFRNPWKFTFDSLSGEVWLADVGQNAYEEINLVTAGGNYGWAFREGSHPGPRAAQEPPGFTSIEPLYEYTHGNGQFQGVSVTGGVVYRGTRIGALYGSYLFADWFTGHVWSLRRTDTGVDVQRLAGEGGIVAFGTDPSNGDVLLVDHDNHRILRLTADAPAGSFPSNLSSTGLFADLTDLTPAPGVLPYQPNLRFWSDHADKRRWFVIPDGVPTMTWSRDDSWSFPQGTIWVKHFDLELERGNPATARRIETRLLVRNSSGAYGVSYRWNDSQTDATLVADAGENLDFSVLEGGVQRTQHYRIPSRAECLVCHTPQAGHALSFNTRQLNRISTINGFHGNQISLLHQAGYLSNTPDSPHSLPRHVRPDETQYPLEVRVRSYLDVNCANCHQAGGTAPPSWDARAHLTLAQTSLINGHAGQNGGDPLNRLIVAGNANRSIVLNRIAAANGFTRMPAIGSTEIDPEGVSLLTQWIQQAIPPNPANQTPVAAPDIVTRTTGQSVKIPIGSLIGNDTDPDGPLALGLIDVSPVSANGASVRRQGSFLIYEGNGGEADDLFSYVVSDGALVTLASVSVQVVSGEPVGPTQNIVATWTVGLARHFRAAGVPGRMYRLQRAGSLSGPWLDAPGAGAVAAATSVGTVLIQDIAPPEDDITFYRVIRSSTP